MKEYDLVVLGGGPAGLAAALRGHENGAYTLIIEREKRIGGILKQCIHEGFGIVKFGERLTGPEYAQRYIDMVAIKKLPIMTSTFVTNVKREGNDYIVTILNPDNGVSVIKSKSLILANGCRERTSKQVFIHGTRPSGIFTAGTAQYYVNILGYLPCKKCVILGSGDIGLIMARRLTLEGSEVLGVYEAKETPSGLNRNIYQCLHDYDIPLHLSHTITRIFGDSRVEGVEISKVDKDMRPIKGTEKKVKCDGVILSVGLIPENEIAEILNVDIDNNTKGPYVDQNFMTLKEGIFSCGNALHVNDLVDYVSESGEMAGENAAKYIKNKSQRGLIKVTKSEEYLYIVPQYIDIKSTNKKIIIYFRSKEIMKNAKVTITSNNKIIFNKKYRFLKPPEMERIEINLEDIPESTKEVNILMEV